MAKLQEFQGFAEVGDLKAGDFVIVDDGFTCISEGSERVVYPDEQELDLFILCRHGRHYLSGQIEGDHYVGIYKVVQ